MDNKQEHSFETVVLGGGCFWCLEPVFEAVRGVIAVEPGYAGGHTDQPNYDSVCSGRTGHAEVVKIDYDKQALDYRDLLRIFFSIHDPTTLNRQGNDVGTQYRSVIFTSTEAQVKQANEIIDELTRARLYEAPIVTQVMALPNYFSAEPVHHRYFEKHPYQGYCTAIIAPKVAKFRKHYHDQLKR